ncbi:MAG: formylglycine-generating enzyme family protein [Planctomycetes bacterium]|nr:formylglycine-generating enzyme family protein [Planctomycetota bacterium]
MEKLIKEKTGKGYVEVGGKAVKAIKPAAKLPAAVKKTSAGGMGKGLSKVEKKAKLLEEDLGKGVKLEMVLIPAGRFMMGSPASENGRGSSETQHEVTLTKPFYMGKYAVTQEQWEAVMGNNPSETKGAKLPVTCVSWEDCQEFIEKLNTSTKGNYRLPTEAEWEYACRAGTSTTHSFGNKISPKDANYYDSKIGEPMPVGSYKPNAFGLYDMHGNVWEWCKDWYGNYSAEAEKDPQGPKDGRNQIFNQPYGRVLRGGSFFSLVEDDISGTRSSRRNYNHPEFTHAGLGFRLAMTEVAGQVTTKEVKKEKVAIVLSPAAGRETKSASMEKDLSRAEKKKEAKRLLLMFANGQWELARVLLKAAQEKHWLFEELLKGCGIEDGVPTPSMFLKGVFGEDGYDVGLLEMPEFDCDPDDYFPIKSELAMLEVLALLPEDLKKLLKLQKKGGIHLKVLSKYWKEVADGSFEGVEYEPLNFSDCWLTERDADIARIEKECEERGKTLKKPWKDEEDLGNGIKLEMMLIPAGTFMMGSHHEVTLTKPYYIGKDAVTREQWDQVMGNNSSDYKSGNAGSKSPIDEISWDDCQEFIQKLNAMTKGGYRLPTEAEWEYACRAGTKTAYCFGNELTPFDANYRYSKIGGMETGGFPKGRYKPNAFGLYNMHGNVKEWCKDWHDDYPTKPMKDPKGPKNGEYRVLRGGDAISVPDEICSSSRWMEDPSEGEPGCGFRLARTI